jgi:hypothetical protein
MSVLFFVASVFAGWRRPAPRLLMMAYQEFLYGFYSRAAPEALRLLSEYPTEFASLVATLNRDSRAKVWNFAYYLLRKNREVGWCDAPLTGSSADLQLGAMCLSLTFGKRTENERSVCSSLFPHHCSRLFARLSAMASLQ